jgi:hypothetical protein
MPMTLLKATSFAEAPDDWSEAALAELRENDRNGRVGQELLTLGSHVRLWSIRLLPGERLPFHRHVLDYSWTALEPGRARSRYGDGSVRDFAYEPGETKHIRFGAGESMIHDLTNIGSTPVSFITIELLESANAPLPLDQVIDS